MNSMKNTFDVFILGESISESWSFWENTTDIIQPTTGYNITAEEAHKRYIYALTFRITLALCLVSIFIVTAVLVAMVLYAKYKGWKSRSVPSAAPVLRTGEQARPASFSMSQRPSFARNPMDP